MGPRSTPDGQPAKGGDIEEARKPEGRIAEENAKRVQQNVVDVDGPGWQCEVQRVRGELRKFDADAQQDTDHQDVSASNLEHERETKAKGYGQEHV